MLALLCFSISAARCVLFLARHREKLSLRATKHRHPASTIASVEKTRATELETNDGHVRSSASLVARSMSPPSDVPEGTPGSAPRPLETQGIPRQPQSHSARAGDQSPPLNVNGDNNHGSASSFNMSNTPGATNLPPAYRNENPIPPRGFPREIPSSTQPAPTSPREANGSSSSTHGASQPREEHHEGQSPPEKPATAKSVSTTSDEPEKPSKTIHLKPAHGKKVANKPPAPIADTEEDVLQRTIIQKGVSQTKESGSSVINEKPFVPKYPSGSKERLPTGSKGPSSRVRMHLKVPQPGSATPEACRQTPPDSSKTEAKTGHSSIPSPYDQDSAQGSKPRIDFFLRPMSPNDPSPTPELSRGNDELDPLVSSETLPFDLQTDEELDSDQGAGGLAEMTEDSSCFRYETWKKLRDSDMANNERRAAALKPALLALHKASAQFSASNSVALQLQKQKPLWVSPMPTPTPGMHPRIPLPPPPTHHSKSPPVGTKPYIQPRRAPPPVLPSQQLARRHPTIIGGRPIAAPGQRSYVPRAMSSFVPYGKASVKITKEQIREAIPENASCIFHILDRRVNLDAHAPDASFYSLLRSWVQDDPYRQMPPPGSNILEYVSLPSERRIKERTIVVRPKRKLEDIETCDVFAKLQNVKMPVAELSPKKLREHLVAGSKRIKRLRQKEYLARMEASHENLRSLGIVLPEK